MVSLAATHETILVAATDGTLAADVRPLVRMNVSVIAEQDGRREQGSDGGGGRYSYPELLAGEAWREMADEAVRQAVLNLSAAPAPAGTMTVVLGPGWPGVLLHEAVGHGLEGDFNRKGTSAFTGRMGEKVAAECVTVVDDGTIARRREALGLPSDTKKVWLVLDEEPQILGFTPRLDLQGGEQAAPVVQEQGPGEEEQTAQLVVGRPPGLA